MIARKTKKLIYNLATIVLLVAGMAYVCSRFVHLGHVVYTDNAQVRQHITPVNTRVQGFIKKIYFEEYQPVHRGDTLLVIEDAEFRLRLAQAAVDLARLNLSYTVILATCDGVTGRKAVHEGQLLQPGQTVVEIVDSGDLWVVANYRETQLPRIQEGAEVVFTADAVPDVVYRGVVESISDATGAAFSRMPQDNATGNFVKVEQRVPIRIRLQGNDEEAVARLRAGFNVECKVKY